MIREKRSFSTLELSLACQQLALMLSCGVHIVEALGVLSNGSGPLERALGEVRAGIERGVPLSQALERQGSFPLTFVRSVRPAESSGRLVLVLRQLGERLGKTYKNRARLRSALVYPACVLVVSGLMVAFLLYVQVPMFLRFYTQEKSALPLLTRALLQASRPEVMLLLLAVGLGLFLQGLALSRTPEGRARLRHYFYSLPILGRILRLADLGQMARDISDLLDSGVDLLGLLRLLGTNASGQAGYDRLLLVADSVVAGHGLPEALEQQVEYPALLVSLVRASEEMGRPGRGFGWYARLAEEEVEYSLQAFLALFEPLILGFLGGLVTLIILATFLPTYQVLSG